MKCYKNADKPIKNLAYNKLIWQEQQQPTAQKTAKEQQKGTISTTADAIVAMVENGTNGGVAGGHCKTTGNMLQLLALAKAAANANRKKNNGMGNNKVSRREVAEVIGRTRTHCPLHIH